jgi:hypothetical protein
MREMFLCMTIDYNYGDLLSKTTVEVKKTTLQALEELKREFNVRSLDEAIRFLIKEFRKVPKSKFGAHPEMIPFTPEDEADSHEL